MGRVARYAVNDAVFMLRYAASTVGFLLLFTLFYAALPLSRALHDIASLGAPTRLVYNVVTITGAFTATMIALFVAAVASNVVEREKADGAIEYVLASTSLDPREYLEAKMLSAVIMSLPVALAFAASNGYVLATYGLLDPALLATLLVYMVLASAAFHRSIGGGYTGPTPALHHAPEIRACNDARDSTQPGGKGSGGSRCTRR